MSDGDAARRARVNVGTTPWSAGIATTAALAMAAHVWAQTLRGLGIWFVTLPPHGAANWSRETRLILAIPGISALKGAAMTASLQQAFAIAGLASMARTAKRERTRRITGDHSSPWLRRH